jgi:hypothetical protein
MPSLFSRTRTPSTPLRPQRDHSDEFGRVATRASPRGTATPVPLKKDKNAEKPRTRTLSAAKGRAPGIVPNDDDPLIPDGSFFPLNLDPPRDGAGASDLERGASFLCLSIFPKRPRGTGAGSSYRPV